MSKYQQALDNIKYFLDEHCSDDEVVESVKRLEELLAITTPRKPHWIELDEPLCPNCGEVLDGYQQHCDKCDQRMDWSE